MSEYLSRKQAADFLTARGTAIAKTTLGKLASIGGGPKFYRFGNRALYRREDLLAWVDQRLCPKGG